MSGLRTYEGAVALITGGASGIGAAIAKNLAGRGATVVLADRQVEEAAALARDLSGGRGRAEAVALDVRDAEAFASAVAGVFERHGRLDYLFNNAGTGVGGEAQENTLDDWRYIVEVNLMGVIHGVHAAYARMIGQGFGHIVNTASMAGLMAAPLTASYGATKHAVVGLSRALRVEGKLRGVRVSVFCPGVIRTPILDGAGRYGRVKRSIPAEIQRAMWERLRPMDPDRFAERALGDVARNRSIIVYPRAWRLVWWLNRLAPDLADAVATAVLRRTKREIEAATGGPAAAS